LSFEFLVQAQRSTQNQKFKIDFMPHLRHERVRELLKREIGEAVRREFHVDECGLISVNDVDVAGDLKSAVVFISIFGNAGQQKRGIQALNEHRARIQGLVGKAVVLKFTPTLKFKFDDSIVRGNRVLQIIEELEKAAPAGDHKNSE
jgi:ribosome-binding factor A